MQQLVYIAHGLPASGKSTWANLVCETVPEFKRVNKDDLRAMLHPSQPWTRVHESATVRVRDATIVQLLLLGFSVIVDDTNIQPFHVRAIQTIAAVFGARVTLFHFDVPVDTCIERDAARPEEDKVGAEVIRRMEDEMQTAMSLGWPEDLEVVVLGTDAVQRLRQAVREQ